MISVFEMRELVSRQEDDAAGTLSTGDVASTAAQVEPAATHADDARAEGATTG